MRHPKFACDGIDADCGDLIGRERNCGIADGRGEIEAFPLRSYGAVGGTRERRNEAVDSDPLDGAVEPARSRGP